MAKSETDKQVERLERLLDVGIAALKNKDDRAARLVMQEALKAVEALAQKKQP